MGNLFVKTLQGEEKKLSFIPGNILMEPLRDDGLVDATCGGAASCGTCHIYLAGGWISRTGERTEDEGYMLESLEDFVEVTDQSRLACQIKLGDEHDGIKLEIAPQV